MCLVERGLLDLDADIGGPLGMNIRNPRYPDTPVTFRQLMTHTSSVNENSGFSKLSSTLRSLLEDHPKSNFTDRMPGQDYVYSNFGAGTAGAIMEAATGQSVNAYMTEQVFAPLGIEAAYGASSVRSQEDMGHSVSSNLELDYYGDGCDPNVHFRTTIGSLWIRPRDLLKLACLMGEGGELDGVRLLEPDTVAQMISSQSGVGSVTGDSPYGLFTARVDSVLPDVMLYGHQGSASGFVCNAYFEPESGYAFVLMTNSADQQRNQNINVLARKLILCTYPLVAGDAAGL